MKRERLTYRARQNPWRNDWRWLLAIGVCTSVAAAACSDAQFARDAGLSDARNDGAAAGDARRDVPVSAGACAPGAIPRSKGKAEACSCDGECQTGFCVDGICCTSVCGEPCKACNLPSSLGDCAFVPAGGKPSDPTDCVASTQATCGRDGTCDGKGGCRLYVKGLECKAGTCDGDSVTGIVSCDGNGNCSETSSWLCPPYSCDPATNRCARTCTTDAQCAAGRQCVAGSCGPGPIRQPCDKNADCSSGFCADGVCCNVACSGPCVSCNEPGSPGFCTFIPEGLPDDACDARDRTTCGNNGLCDGFGSCTLYPENTVCGSSSCSGSVQNTQRTCDGKGTCRDPELVDCSPFLCANGACIQNCTSNADCESGYQCLPETTTDGVTTMVCGKKGNGQACLGGSECQSGYCADRTCCESACTGPCRSCGLASSPGRCMNVANGAPDPRNTCEDLGAAACSTSGLCDGNGACKAYPAGTVCGPQTCVAGVHTPASTCNASGQCTAPPSSPCYPYVCNADTCYDSCTSSSIQCATGNFCTDASCGPKPDGAVCSAGKECKSGFCAQGVCCNSACTDACMACNLSATAGLCTAVADNAPDPQGKCVATASNTCGTTGNCLKGSCGYWTGNCAPATCASTSSVRSASTCDGAGACVAGPVFTCNNQACVSGACQGVCAPGQLRCFENGVQTCTATGTWGTAVPCSSQACVNGACTGSCTPGSKQCSGNGVQTCGANGTWGTAVDCGTQACVSGACQGDCAPDSTKCSGNGVQTCSATGTWGAAVPCVNKACVGGVCIGSCTPGSTQCSGNGVQTCDGNGAWGTAVVSCAGFTCASGNCSTSCTLGTNAGCATGYYCSGGNSCLPMKANGTACAGAAECTSARCVAKEGGGGSICCAKGCPDGMDKCGNNDQCLADGSGCVNSDNASCNDGDACTQTDTCQAGSCVGGNPRSCTASDACHVAGTCDPGTGTCSNPNAADGTGCNDGNANTVGDICTNGTCAGVDHCIDVICTALDQCHVAGTCVDHATGACSNPNAPDGTGCNDGNADTAGDICTNGTCGGVDHCIGVTCTALDQCHVAGTCIDHATGACSNPNAPDGTGCNDGNADTTGDACAGGVCAGVDLCAGVTCTALDQCHVAGTCDTSTGLCSNPPASDGTECVDTNLCTAPDTCQAGSCISGPDVVVCSDPSTSCNPATGACEQRDAQ